MGGSIPLPRDNYMKPLPTSVDQLIQDLNEQYPEKSPDPKDSDREIWIKAGQRAVVNMLLTKQRMQQEEEYQIPSVIENNT